MSAVLERQVELLLARVRREARERCAELEHAATGEIEAIRRQARTDAHARVRSAAAEKRSRVREQCRLAVAAAQSATRAAEFAAERQWLQDARGALHAVLVARWTDPVARERWWRDALRLAARRLRTRDWTIEAPPLDDAEAAALDAYARELGATARLHATPELPAGLRVRAGNAVLDATPDGLLVDAAAIDARLLAAREEPS